MAPKRFADTPALPGPGPGTPRLPGATIRIVDRDRFSPAWGQKKGSFMLQAVRLPSPTVDMWAWQQLASCRGAVSSMFFGREGESRRARIERERVAKDLCSRCEVIAECRDHALTVGEPYGIWGGLSATERQTLAGR